MNDQKNTLLAIVLSAVVLIVWQIFVGMPQIDKQKQAQQQQTQQQQQQPGQGTPQSPPGNRAARLDRADRPGPDPGRRAAARPARRGPDAQPRADPRPVAPRPDRDAAARRLDLAQGRAHRRPVAHHATARPSIPNRPPIVLLAPVGQRSTRSTPSSAGRRPAAPPSSCPARTPCGRQVGAGTLGVDRPVTLTWDNGEGLEFRRTHRGRRQLHVHRQGRGA